MRNPIDVRIANRVKRICENHIKKRSKYKTPLELQQEKDTVWNNNFLKGKTEFVHPLTDDLKIILDKDSHLSKKIFFSFEEEEIQFTKNFLKESDCFFDIGANIGLYSLHASKYAGNKGAIFAFEPTPTTYKKLCSNLELNKISNVYPQNIALSDKSGSMIFNVSKKNYDAWNSFAKLKQLNNNSEEITVKTVTLDEFIEEKNIKQIDLIKLDVEGWELYVLKGAIKLLSSKTNIPVWLIEFTEANTFAAGYYCGEIFDYMELFGYKWYAYDVEKNELFPKQKELHYPYQNLIAIKNLDDCKLRLNII